MCAQAAFMACFETNILIIEGETCFANTCVFQSKKTACLELAVVHVFHLCSKIIFWLGKTTCKGKYIMLRNARISELHSSNTFTCAKAFELGQKPARLHGLLGCVVKCFAWQLLLAQCCN